MKYWTITISADNETELDLIRQHLDTLWEGDDETLSSLIVGVTHHGVSDNRPTSGPIEFTQADVQAAWNDGHEAALTLATTPIGNGGVVSGIAPRQGEQK